VKKLIIVLSVLVTAAWLGWQNRVNLLVWAMPKIQSVVNPVAENIPNPWTVGPVSAVKSNSERPPNIILILADDMGFNDISLYNGGAADGSVMTPNIDSIARLGVRFDNGYAANAVCAPSRATLLTGRYSTRFGFEFTPFPKIGATIFQWMADQNPPVLPGIIDHEALGLRPPFSELGMPTEEITIAELLKDKGYYTAHIGKWHLGSIDGMRPEDQGFDDSLYMSGLLYLPEDDPNVVNAKFEEDGIDRMVWASARYAAQFNGGSVFEPVGYLTDYYTNEAVKVIENHRNEPFFIYLAHWGIHNPLQATREDYDRFSHIDDHPLRVYAAMIHALDRGVGKVVEALEKNGLSENTLIVFTSDNGGADYIGLPNINKPYRGWKLTLFEGGTHVPYMAKWPAQIEANGVMHEPIHHIDMFHTFAAAAGVEVPDDRKLDGVNLLPFIRKEVTGAPHQTLFWKQGHQQTVQHEGWKLIRAMDPQHGQMHWLFDLGVDPTEQKNLASEKPQQLALMNKLLDNHEAELPPPAWPQVIDSPKLIDKTGMEAYAEGDEYIYWPN